MNIVLMHNAKSGSSKSLRELKNLLKSGGLTVRYSFTVQQLKSRKLANLIAEGVTIAAIGGDGTLNAVARLIVGTESILLPLPGGTFNHFIRDLGMSANVEEVMANMQHAKKTRVDVGYVNDELFLNNSNIGLYPFSLIERKKTKQLVGKYPAAVLSAFDQLAIFRRHKLVIDGVKVRAPFVFVGNNAYEMTNAFVPQRSKLTRGILTIMIATSSSRLQLIATVAAVLRGKSEVRDDFTLRVAPAIRIDSHHAYIPVSFDGEVKRLVPPLMYRSRPKSLHVMYVPMKK